MAVYVVTWNLNKEGAAYTAARATFLKHLAKYDNTQDPAWKPCVGFRRMKARSRFPTIFVRNSMTMTGCLSRKSFPAPMRGGSKSLSGRG